VGAEMEREYETDLSLLLSISILLETLERITDDERLRDIIERNRDFKIEISEYLVDRYTD